MKKIFAVTLAGLIMAFVSCAVPVFADAQVGSRVKSVAGFEQYRNIIGFDEVKGYAVIPKRDDVLIVDARPSRKFAKGHIPVAINIPQSQFKKRIAKLPKDKSTALIYYCGGLKCPLSHKSARQAEALGYSNVYVYAAGYPDWVAHGWFPGVTARYVKYALAKKRAVVVDARPPRKFKKGHVRGSINIPATRFDAMAAQLPKNKKAELIFYCGGYKCPLSAKAGEKALFLGYTNIKLFQGGYPAWKAAYGR